MGNTLLFVLICSVIVVIVTVSLLYRSYYRYRINNRLTENTEKSGRLLSPLTVLLTTTLVTLVAFGTITGLLAAKSPVDIHVPALTSDFKVFAQSEMNGYRSNYSKTENPGYTKYTEETEEISFTYFISDEEFDNYHPSIIVYADYLGDKEIAAIELSANYLDDSGLAAGSEVNINCNEAEICVFGSSDSATVFKVAISYYDTVEGPGTVDHLAAEGVLIFDFITIK